MATQTDAFVTFELENRTPKVGAFKRATRALASIFGSIGNAIQAQRDFDELNNLSDRELRDIGITRVDISRLVYEKNFGSENASARVR